MLIDLQNDFLRTDGATGRAVPKVDNIAQLPGRLKPLAVHIRKLVGWIL